MKTSIRAIFVCGSFGLCAAHASTVTLYGTVDAGLQYQSIKIPNVGSASRTGMHSGGQTGNRWGLTGSENLGNGWRAIFTLEAGYALENGRSIDQSRTAFSRQLFTGLASDQWGTLTLGRQYNQGFLYFGALGPFGNGFGLGSQSTTFGNSMVRYDNMIKYETPNLSGLQAAIGHSNEAGYGDGSDWNDNATSGLAAGVRYTRGPWAAAATFDRLAKAEQRAGSAGTGSIKAWQAGLSYDFEAVKLTLELGQDIGGRIAAGNTYLAELGGDIPVPNARYVDDFRANNYLLGASAPFGRGRLLAAWGVSDSNLNERTAGDNGIATQHALTLGYTYLLSKRTNLYAVGSYVNNAAYIDGARAQEYRVGLLHRF